MVLIMVDYNSVVYFFLVGHFVILYTLCSCEEIHDSFKALQSAIQTDTNNSFAIYPDEQYRDGAFVLVNTRIVISDAKPVKDDSLEIIVHLQSTWFDKRLAFVNTTFQNMTILPSLVSKVWTPETYLEPDWNTEEKRVMRVFSKGAVGESKRIRATIPCNSIDVGIDRTELLCTTKITSYTYLEDQVVLKWTDQEPLQLKYGALDTFSQIKQYEYATCHWDTLNEWGSSCLEVQLYVIVEYKSVLFRVYLPSFMAVMMAWSSFWIHRDETSARVKLGTLVTWTVMTEYLSIELAFPHYLDNIAGNVWMLGCMIFTWISFLLYATIHVLRRREVAALRHEEEREKQKTKETERTGERALSISSVHPECRFDNRGLKGYSVWERKEKYKLTSHIIYVSSFTLERWCRIWYGVVFFGFTALFTGLFGRNLFL